MTTKTYLVTTRHPTGWQDGVNTFTVKPSTGKEGYFYATAPKFGCSKDYRGEKTPIYEMCRDNACTVVRIEEKLTLDAAVLKLHAIVEIGQRAISLLLQIEDARDNDDGGADLLDDALDLLDELKQRF